MESKFFDLTVELTVGFLALFAITKFLRRTQITQITPFDFISALVLGELVGNAIYDDDINITYILYAVFIWGCLMFIIEKITQKFRRSRKILEGDPAIVIRDGQIDYNVLKKEKLDINELLGMLRQKEIFSIREVEFAILESSGAISVLKKSKYAIPTIEDLNLSQKPIYLSINLILDGEVIYDNLKTIGFDEQWLKNQIHNYGIENIKDVLYAEWKQDEGIHVILKNNKKS
ncbi:DUF421 domain-containing protein [Clostridium sp. D2Q-11]|uniref:DUF421 domain-containing protein n=1 Tax=Anaeromonas frigoriresistens TaxID=2683708 RepID=A0A942Z7A3_9FIRM|nr:DUF421 domain-containing protein [Anaeromonas frigoriresistens]MBS4539346.1 DUF421 domain-containing protein [Anaeromonas frigoriresistens]